MKWTTELTDAERERLALLQEEMAEAIQIVSKIERHGFESRNPLALSGPTNREELARELGHVCAALDIIGAQHDIDVAAMHQYRLEKLEQVGHWLHFQPPVPGADSGV